MTTAISLVVVRTEDLERAREFYDLLGLALVSEQHGSGPQHYSFTSSGTVFELYPAGAAKPDISTRLGFTVPDGNSVVDRLKTAGHDIAASPKGRGSEVCAVVIDPDGRKVELTSPAV